MKYTLTIFAGLILLVFGSGVVGQTRCQDGVDSAASRFDRSTVNHRVAVEGLLRQRGISLAESRDVSAASIAQTLATADGGYAKGTAVLFYAYAGSSLRVWLITEGGIRAYCQRVLSPQQLANAIERLRNALGLSAAQRSRTPRLLVQTGAAIPSPPRAPLAPAAGALSEILIPPVVARELTGVHHLIVVPILDIGTVPFALLEPFRSNEVLIDRMSVTVAPDLAALVQPTATWDRHFTSPLVVGNPYLPPDPRWELPPLPGAEREAVQIGAMLNVQPLLATFASRGTILRQVESADGLFFAAHGVANSNDPLSGGFLAFSAADFRSGWWTAKEVQSTKLRAKLAVLSACQTGLGQTHDAGIIGLARAFQLAGVPRVVMSLWSVDDAASNDLMQAFMRNLLVDEQPPPAEALRRAMVELKRKQPDPSKWAAFMVFGTPR